MSDNALVFINAEGRPQYRASGIYNCLSVLVASRLGLEANSPPDWLMERFQQGHDFEGMVLERAKERGYKRLDNFQMELRQDVGPAVLVGHIDALAHGTPVPDSINGVAGVLLPDDDEAITVVDAKAFAPSTYQSWEKRRFDAFPYYAWQLTVYKTALERELKRPVNIGMAVGLKNMEAASRGELKLDGFRLDLFTESPVPFGRVMARILEVEKIARSEGMDGIPAKCDNPTFPCFAEGTLVLTREGYRPIESIEVGTQVLTHMGRWRTVTKTYRTENVPLRSVVAQGSPVLLTTDDHPFYERRKFRRKVDSRSRRGWTSAEWVKASELVDGRSFVAQTLPPEEPSTLSPEMLWLAGRWLADGWMRTPKGSGILIACGDESEVEEVRRYAEKLDLHTVVSAERTVYKVHFVKAELARFMSQFGEYAYGKSLPGWAFTLPTDLARALLDGYLSGDGCRVKTQEIWSASTVSRSLAFGIALLAQRAFGVVASVHYYDRGLTTVIEGRTVNTRPTWAIKISDRNNFAVLEGSYGWKPVRSTSRLDRIATVYNLEVEEDQSYMVESVLVHNCPFFAYPFHSAKEADSTIDETAIEGGLGTIAVLADKRNEAYRAMKDAEKVVAECDEQMKAAVGDAIGSVKVAKMSAQVSSVTFYHSSYTTTNWDQVQADYPGFDRAKYQDQRPSSKLSVRVNPKRVKREEGGD